MRLNSILRFLSFSEVKVCLLFLSMQPFVFAEQCLQVPVGCRVTSAFGGRYDPVKKDFTQQIHKGVDFGCPMGTPVVSAASGAIETAGFSESAGNWVVINGSDGLYKFKYMHHKQNDVQKPGNVKVGQQLAFSGNTGNRTTGPHLHFQVESQSTGKAVDPNTLFCSKLALTPGVLQGAPSSAPGDTGDDIRSAKMPGDNDGIPPKIGFDGSLDQVMSDVIASRSLNPDYMEQLATLSTPRLYAELAYMQAISLKIKANRGIHRERILATQAMIQILLTEATLRPQIDMQRSAATKAAVINR